MSIIEGKFLGYFINIAFSVVGIEFVFELVAVLGIEGLGDGMEYPIDYSTK